MQLRLPFSANRFIPVLLEKKGPAAHQHAALQCQGGALGVQAYLNFEGCARMPLMLQPHAASYNTR